MGTHAAVTIAETTLESDDARKVVQRHYAAFNARDLDSYAASVDENVRLDVGYEVLLGRQAVLSYAIDLIQTNPRVHVTLDVVAKGAADTIVCELRLDEIAEAPGGTTPAAEATHPPLRATAHVCDVIEVRGGRIVELRRYRTFPADRPTDVGHTRSRNGADRTRVQTWQRQVAAVAAVGAGHDQIVFKVNEAVGELVGGEATWLIHFEDENRITLLGTWGRNLSLPFGTRQDLSDELLSVRETGRPYRFQPTETAAVESFATEADRLGIVSSVGVPIFVGGRVWGLGVAARFHSDPFPPTSESVLEEFFGAVAPLLDIAHARRQVEQVAVEQAALHRVAVLAADADGPDEVFRAIAAEASALLNGGLTALMRFGEDDVSGIVVAVSGGHATIGAQLPTGRNTLAGRIRRSGNTERIDDYTTVPGASAVAELGIRAAVAAPISVDGRLWGILEASSLDAPLPAGTEERLSQFAKIAAAAISSSQARRELRQLADEQGALRRVAELVALGASETQLFDAVAVEATGLIGGEGTNLVRFDGPRTFTIVATRGGPAPVGLQVEIPEDSTGSAATAMRTRRAARKDDYHIQVGAPFDRKDFGVGSSVSVPIIVEGQLWGLLGTVAEGRRLPDETEDRLEKFAQLVAAALANSQARAELQQLADERGALLRVARLVAREVTEQELFDAVAVEAAGLIENEATTLVRYEGDRSFTIISTFRGPAAVGTRIDVPADDQGTLDELLRTLRPSRLDEYGKTGARQFSQQDYGVGSSVSVPIIVEDRLWGALGTLTQGRRLPAYTEERLEKFVELVAAALANSHARTQLQRLAEEQTALRRVAELVAHGATLDEVFAGVATEASRLLDDMSAALLRHDADGFATVVATCNSAVPVGLRVPMADEPVIGHLFQSGERFPVASSENADTAEYARDHGVGAGTAAPISVEGRVWGALTTSMSGGPPPRRAADRLEELAALAAAAIANAENKAKLTASRARVVATADETRHRLQRDVHDGAQQRLVQTVLTLKLGQAAAQRGDATANLIDEALGYAERATSELRDLVHGILPASLSRGGLRAGLESLIADITTPVELTAADSGLPADAEVTAYFIVAEALTNVEKHAHATRAWVDISVTADVLNVQVRDDGCGGADPSLGSGLTGLFDRIEAAEGALTITSPHHGGTLLRAEFPLPVSP